MKITNEQARGDISGYVYFSETNTRIMPMHRKCYEYASDLLEARAQRDKLLAALKSIDCSTIQAHRMTYSWLEASVDVCSALSRDAIAELEATKCD